jgi:hypothetical protein
MKTTVGIMKSLKHTKTSYKSDLEIMASPIKREMSPDAKTNKDWFRHSLGD